MNQQINQEVCVVNKKERGATFVEYVLLIVLVGVALVGALSTFKGTLSTGLSSAGAQVSGAN